MFIHPLDVPRFVEPTLRLDLYASSALVRSFMYNERVGGQQGSACDMEARLFICSHAG